MRDRGKTNIDQSLKDMDEHITWSEERRQHARKMLLSKMEQENPPKQKSWIKRWAAPVAAAALFLGTAGTLVVSELSEQQQTSERQHEQQINIAEKSEQDYGIVMDAEVESEIMEIKASGFDLQLPQYSPAEGTKIKSIWYRSEGQNNTVTASYFDDEGNEVFKFMQEGITEHTDISHLRENADYETEINENITFVSGNDHSGLRTINMVTNAYGFTLYTYDLSVEELIRVGESIE